MATPLRHMPMTPLDELRAWLGSPMETDPGAQVSLNQLLHQLRQLALPEPYHVACGVALGYEDEAAPINALRSTRAPWADWGELRGFD